MTKRKTAVVEPAQDEALPAGGTTDEDLGITPEIRLSIAAAEADTRKWLQSEKTARITVPRQITVMPSLLVQVNGVAYHLPIGVEVEAPESIVAIARQRIEAAQAQESRARASDVR